MALGAKSDLNWVKSALNQLHTTPKPRRSAADFGSTEPAVWSTPVQSDSHRSATSGIKKKNWGRGALETGAARRRALIFRSKSKTSHFIEKKGLLYFHNRNSIHNRNLFLFLFILTLYIWCNIFYCSAIFSARVYAIFWPFPWTHQPTACRWQKTSTILRADIGCTRKNPLCRAAGPWDSQVVSCQHRKCWKHCFVCLLNETKRSVEVRHE